MLANPKELCGFKLYANYGAMFPTVEGTVTNVDKNGLVEFVDEDGERYHVHVDAIRSERPSSGSPIGVYFNEFHAY